VIPTPVRQDPGPLVTIGVPVRNGAPALARALDSLVRQTHRHLEIIVSDNASTDATESICRDYAGRDPRVRYIRHARPIGVIQNFRTPVDAGRGDFFMWAAYDDVREENYVEVLLAALGRHETASLAFSSAAAFAPLHAWQAAEPMRHSFETAGLSFLERVRQHTSNGCTHVYGLIRASLLREYPWFETEEGWDVVFLMWLATRGPFIFTPGTTFYYYKPPSRSAEERALENNHRALPWWWPEQKAWACASAVADASRRAGRPIGRLHALPVLYFHMLQGARGIVARFTPARVRAAYRGLTRRRGTRERQTA
jgi:GT2 family glycosyltransferase